MSLQIFLQGKLLGIEEFLFAPSREDHDQVFTGRSHWISLLSEVLPRALLAELGLAKILLGSSGGGQFLLVLPEESRAAAEAFLQAAAPEIAALSDGSLKLLWSVTENLGDWSDVRRRLTEQMDHRRGTPAVEAAPAESRIGEFAEEYFARATRNEAARRGVGWVVAGNIRDGFRSGKGSMSGAWRDRHRSDAVRPPRRSQR